VADPDATSVYCFFDVALSRLTGHSHKVTRRTHRGTPKEYGSVGRAQLDCIIQNIRVKAKRGSFDAALQKWRSSGGYRKQIRDGGHGFLLTGASDDPACAKHSG